MGTNYKSIRTKDCPKCKSHLEVPATQDQIDQYFRVDGPYIQDIFPSLPPQTRERFISGYCPPCWDKLFESTEE